MLSLSLSPNPQSPSSLRRPRPPRHHANSNIRGRARAIACSAEGKGKHTPRSRSRTTPSRAGGGTTPPPDPLLSGPAPTQRNLPWFRWRTPSPAPSPLRLQRNGEKHVAEPKQHNSNVSHKTKDNKRVSDSSANDFLRYNSSSDIADMAGELQVSIVRYKKTFPWRLFNPKLQVDLVSAVHIADRRYFEILQERLASYDCVLYEGVGDKDDPKPETEMEGYNITGFIQRLMGYILSMDFQLDCVNYKWHNWYNADLDWDTFQRLQEERGETFLAAAKNALGTALKSDVDSSDVQLGFDSLRSKLLRVSWIIPMPLAISLVINMTCSPDSPEEDKDDMDDFGNIVSEFLELGLESGLKVILARSLTSMFASEIYADLEEDSVIIGERNKAALEELKKAISRGEKRIAIFYGAGHMPDLGRKLRRDFSMVPTDVDWVTAWSIRKNKSKISGLFFQKYIGRYLPFSKEMGKMLVVGSVSCSFLLLDLWLWWSAFNVAYRTGFQMVRLVRSLVIM